MAARRALVLLAEGAEEMETVITVDVLRRGGVEVFLAGLNGNAPVKCSRQVVVSPDMSVDDALSKHSLYDAVILPGGLGGADKLAKSSLVQQILSDHEKNNRIVAAICAAPTVFKAHNIAISKRVTSYPSTKNIMTEGNQYNYVDNEKVVVDGNIVTSRGPGTAFDFALELVKILVDKETADKVANGMILQRK